MAEKVAQGWTAAAFGQAHSKALSPALLRGTGILIGELTEEAAKLRGERLGRWREESTRSCLCVCYLQSLGVKGQ